VAWFILDSRSYQSPSAAVMPGTVCVPHGFGHSEVDGGPRRAAARDGPSINDITDEQALDISGNAAFNGTPVSIEPASQRV
jgi:hypothetical protein